jgi:hypothetical protein
LDIGVFCLGVHPCHHKRAHMALVITDFLSR